MSRKTDCRWLSSRAPFDVKYAWFYTPGNSRRNHILKLKDVLEDTFEVVRPKMSATYSINQLPRDAQAVPGLADGALKHVANAKLATDLLDIDGFSLVGEAGIAGDDEQPFHSRQRSRDILDHAVGEIFLFRIAAHVLKRQHGDGGFVGEHEGLRSLGRRLCCRRRAWADAHAPNPHRFGDILQGLRTQIL